MSQPGNSSLSQGQQRSSQRARNPRRLEPALAGGDLPIPATL